MNIIFSPIVRRPGTDYELHMLSVEGDTLTVNGTEFTLTALEYDEETGLAGYILSATRDATDGWTVTLLLPIGDNASEAQRFPEPVTVTSGPVPLPAPPEEEAEETTTAEAE
ncbi:hypothetical protein ABEB22_00315 [Thioclava sp. 'Guangxiensis']|uniref:hypothetical protein n=1 Tax=Thioclava sp. 'Guangxiensis' TaxID=3149044 RepID=UPI003877EC04